MSGAFPPAGVAIALSAPLLLGAIWCMRRHLLPALFEKPQEEATEEEEEEGNDGVDDDRRRRQAEGMEGPQPAGTAAVVTGTRAVPGCSSGRAGCSSGRLGCSSGRLGCSSGRDRAAQQGAAAAASAALAGWKQRQPESTPPWLQRENTAAAAAAAARAGKLRSHGAIAGEGSPTKRTRERIQASIAAAKGAAARTTSPTKFERLQTAELARFERVQADLSLPARSYPRDFRQNV